MIHLGLCSVTLRALPVPAVLRCAARAGLEVVEWGGDVHVPPGDAAAAAEVRRRTADAGLRIASYGSYLRCETADPVGAEAEERAVLETAAALGAPRVRVWAGSVGSEEAPPGHRDLVTRTLRRLGEQATSQGLEIGLEFHGGTLTDDVGSTLDLLDAVDHPAVRTYWQPPVGMPATEALAGLDRVLPRLAGVHAFSWWPRQERLPLAARADLWSAVLARLQETDRDHDVLLEFVPEDDPDLLAGEASILRELLPGVRPERRTPGGPDGSPAGALS